MDPLAQLQDIQLPEQVSNYPVAIGWLCVYALLVIAIIVCTVKLIQHAKRKRDQKAALKQMLLAGSASEYITVLKWAAMAYFPRKQVANLSGKTLTDFLSSVLPESKQSPFSEHCQDLLTTYYQKPFSDQEKEQLKAAIEFWIKHALPPSKKIQLEAL